jgi:hypothetical protein
MTMTTTAQPIRTPTAEQFNAIDLFCIGSNLAIEAGAGAGKTSTLVMLAEAAGKRRGQYAAFNKALVVESSEKFGSNVACNTAHSLAFRQVGNRFAHRLRSARMRSDQIAKILRISPMIVDIGNGNQKSLSQAKLAGYVMKGINTFCQSADPEPTTRHLPYIEGIDLPQDGHRTYTNNNEVRDSLLKPLQTAWRDLSATTGILTFSHGVYLKVWQLSKPTINADFILFDEAQDASPVMWDAILQQRNSQIVAVGDSAQMIYGFLGCINAMEQVPDSTTAYLSKSFRFGQPVADEANKYLARLGAKLRLSGNEAVNSHVGPVADPDCILTRSNAEAIRQVFEALRVEKRPFLVGGGTETISFCEAAMELQSGKPTYHPELACFESWSDVQDYVQNDEQGGELRLMVKLINDFTAQRIIRALKNGPRECDANLVISTAHKSKGREWGAVQLAGDFLDCEDISDDELRLLYVAVTRAKRELDVTNVKHKRDGTGGEKE